MWMKTKPQRTSVAVQCLRLNAPNAGGLDSIPGRGTRIPRVMGCGQKKKREMLQKAKPQKCTIMNCFCSRNENQIAQK